MNLRFMIVHMVAKLPQYVPGMGDLGINLVVTCIIDDGDKRIHKYGLRVEIPEGHIGILLPVSTMGQRIEKMGPVGIIRPEDIRKEITAVFTYVDELVYEAYKEGEVSACLIVVPVTEYTTELVNW